MRIICRECKERENVSNLGAKLKLCKWCRTCEGCEEIIKKGIVHYMINYNTNETSAYCGECSNDGEDGSRSHHYDLDKILEPEKEFELILNKYFFETRDNWVVHPNLSLEQLKEARIEINNFLEKDGLEVLSIDYSKGWKEELINDLLTIENKITRLERQTFIQNPSRR